MSDNASNDTCSTRGCHKLRLEQMTVCLDHLDRDAIPIMWREVLRRISALERAIIVSARKDGGKG